MMIILKGEWIDGGLEGGSRGFGLGGDGSGGGGRVLTGYQYY